MTAYIVSFYITAVANVLLAIFLFYNNFKSVLNKTAALFSLTIAIYCFSFVTTITSDSKIAALFWNRFLYIGVTFMPILFLHFTYAILSLLKRKKYFYYRTVLLLYLSLSFSQTCSCKMLSLSFHLDIIWSPASCIFPWLFFGLVLFRMRIMS